MNEVTNIRLYNTTALKAHALKCSKETRAGKFERVGESFLNAIEADIETVIRSLAAASPLVDGFKEVNPEGAQFVTGATAERLAEKLNEVIGRIIQRRVHRHPSVGKTLLD